MLSSGLRDSPSPAYKIWNILGISLASARMTSPWVTERTWNTLLQKFQRMNFFCLGNISLPNLESAVELAPLVEDYSVVPLSQTSFSVLNIVPDRGQPGDCLFQCLSYA